MLSVSFLLLFNLKHFKLKYSWFKYSISFKWTTQWFNLFTDYTPFKVIIKYWLYSLCYAVYSYSLKVLVAQSCLTLCDSMDCNLPGSSVPGILQARIVEWVAISFPRGIIPAQGLNSSLLHCRQILYHLSYQGSPTIDNNNVVSSRDLSLIVPCPKWVYN